VNSSMLSKFTKHQSTTNHVKFTNYQFTQLTMSFFTVIKLVPKFYQ